MLGGAGPLLRRRVAEGGLGAGVQDAVAASMMGNADTRILRRYQEVVDQLSRDAAARMDRLLGGEGRR